MLFLRLIPTVKIQVVSLSMILSQLKLNKMINSIRLILMVKIKKKIIKQNFSKFIKEQEV